MKAYQNKFGPLRTFSTEDVVNALLYLKGGPIARKRLSKLLELGEGATRTIIKILMTGRLIETIKKGCVLTKNGFKELRKITGKIAEITEIPSSGLTYHQPATCLVLKKASKSVKNGLEERDVAVKAGASGATILANLKGAICFPDSSTKVGLAALPPTEEGDVVILSYGQKQRKAAIAVALHVMRKKGDTMTP